MKKINILFVACLIVFPAALFAQENSKKKEKSETIIIEEGSDKGNTTIEIKNGEVFIDGKKVTEGIGDKDKNVKIVKKKIIVNGKEINEAEMDLPSFNFPFDSDDLSDKPMLGVSSRPSKNNEGAEVESVVKGSPAEKLGLQKGDLITRVNDKNIRDPKDLVDAISGYKPGDAIDITYERDSKMMTKNVVLSEKKDAMVFRGNLPFDEENMFRLFDNRNGNFMELPFNNFPGTGNSPKIGVSVEDRADADGVLVNEVAKGSAAEKAGILPQDLITVYNGKKIGDVDDLVTAIADAKSKETVSVETKRNGQEKKLILQVPKTMKKRDL